MSRLSERDLISRKAAVSRISDLIVLELRCERIPTWNEVYKALNEVPTVDAVPVKHGRWKDRIACSNCGWMMIDDILESRWLVAFPYCPNCGAKMDGERREDGDED